MGHGYAILLWDSYGVGLVRINARLHSEGADAEGNPINWWFCKKDDTDVELLERHLDRGTTLSGFKGHYRVIRD